MIALLLSVLNLTLDNNTRPTTVKNKFIADVNSRVSFISPGKLTGCEDKFAQLINFDHIVESIS